MTNNAMTNREKNDINKQWSTNHYTVNKQLSNSNHPNKKGNEVCVFHVSLVAHDMVVENPMINEKKGKNDRMATE